MVAVELAADRAELLDRFISDNEMADVLKPYYGFNQASPQVLREVDRQFGDEDIDLVLDDASHLSGPTRQSFEMLFPRLCAGGVYVIEDWAGQHMLLASVVDGTVNRSVGWQRMADGWLPASRPATLRSPPRCAQILTARSPMP